MDRCASRASPHVAAEAEASLTMPAFSGSEGNGGCGLAGVMVDWGLCGDGGMVEGAWLGR